MSNTKKQILLFTILLAFTIVGILLVSFEKANKRRFIFNTFINKTSSLKAVFLDIGQGDATLLEFPDKRQMLIDCSKDRKILNALGRNMRFWDKTIDYLVITHPDRDHYGGCLDVIKRFDVKNIMYTGFQKKGDQFWEEFSKEIQSNSGYQKVAKGKKMRIADVDVDVLSPSPKEIQSTTKDSNATSIVLKIRYGENDLLLMGDAEMDIEERLMEEYKEYLDVEVLKVGHHGSAGATSRAFLEVTSPLFAIISSGEENYYGHPTPRVIRKLERSKAEILRTDQKGDIILLIEKEKIYVK